MRWPVRGVWLPALLVLLSGCEGGKLEAAKKRAQEAEAARRAAEEEAAAATARVETLRAQLRTLETEHTSASRVFEELQAQLAGSWRGDPALLAAVIERAKLPEPLRAVLQEAQKVQGAEAPEQLFTRGVQAEDVDALGNALNAWQARVSLPAHPEPEEAAEEENTCKKTGAKPTCTPFPLYEGDPGLTQFCRFPSDKSGYVVRSNGGVGEKYALIWALSQRYRSWRIVGDRWWVFIGESDKPLEHRGQSARTWLEVFRIQGSTGSTREEYPLEANGQKADLADVDLDGDGLAETVITLAGRVRALRLDPKAGDVEAWADAEACRRVASRTEDSLRPAREACAAWEKAQGAGGKDGG